MEFWGIEVKSGQPLKVEPGNGMILHLSQACLGETKKKQDNEMVRLYVKNRNQKAVLGNLSLENFPQVSFDLVFGDEFELSHDWKHGSVHFAGYRVVTPEEETGDESDDDSDIGEPVLVHGTSDSKQAKPAFKPKAAEKPEAGATKPKVNFAQPSKTEEVFNDSEIEEDEEDDSRDDEEMANAEDVGSDEDEEDSDKDEDESDEETPKRVQASSKRVADSATKTPTLNKKSKLATPRKTDGNKVGLHVATPHPAKQAGKPPANSDKSKQKIPKSGGSFTCDSCSRSFGSEQALQSHSKAKHSA